MHLTRDLAIYLTHVLEQLLPNPGLRVPVGSSVLPDRTPMLTQECLNLVGVLDPGKQPNMQDQIRATVELDRGPLILSKWDLRPMMPSNTRKHNNLYCIDDPFPKDYF